MENTVAALGAVLRSANDMRVKPDFIFLTSPACLQVALVAEPLCVGNFSQTDTLDMESTRAAITTEQLAS